MKFRSFWKSICIYIHFLLAPKFLAGFHNSVYMPLVLISIDDTTEKLLANFYSQTVMVEYCSLKNCLTYYICSRRGRVKRGLKIPTYNVYLLLIFEHVHVSIKYQFFLLKNLWFFNDDCEQLHEVQTCLLMIIMLINLLISFLWCTWHCIVFIIWMKVNILQNIFLKKEEGQLLGFGREKGTIWFM